MLPRSKKQKIDYAQIREEADALIKSAFEIQKNHGTKRDFCLAVQKGLAVYIKIPQAERHADDWCNILDGYLYIFNQLDQRHFFKPNDNLDKISDTALAEFDQIVSLLGQPEYAAIANDISVRYQLAYVQAHICYHLLKPDLNPNRKVEIFNSYCVPASGCLIQEQAGSDQEEQFCTYDAISQSMLGEFYVAMGDFVMARHCHGHAIAGMATLDKLRQLDIKFIKGIYRAAADSVVLHGLAGEHPVLFLKSVYAGTARYQDFVTVCEGVANVQDRALDLSRFFVQGLALIQKHLKLGILPDSNFQQHMQHEQFHTVFDSFRERITERHMALQDMLLNHSNVQVGLLGEVVGLRARVRELEQQEVNVSRQSLFKSKKGQVKRKKERPTSGSGPVTRSQTKRSKIGL